MKEDSLQKQINNVASNLAGLIEQMQKRDKVLNVTCGGVHYIVGAKTPGSTKLRKQMGCKDLQRCLGKDWPGADFKAKAATDEIIA